MHSGSFRLRSIAPFIPFLTIGFGCFIASNAWVTMLGYHLGILLILFLERQGKAGRTLLKGNHYPILVAAIISSAVSGIFLYFASPIMGIPSGLGAWLAGQGLKGTSWPIFILYYSVVNPFLEEWYWRGYLGSISKRIVISDVCYAGYHPLVLTHFLNWPWLILEFLILIGVAWTWRQIAVKTEGLLIPVVSHLTADASLIIAIYLLAFH